MTPGDFDAAIERIALRERGSAGSQPARGRPPVCLSSAHTRDDVGPVAVR
jgi:hypothetical protein